MSNSGDDRPTDVTELLLAWRAGDSDALERLMPLVYDELRRLARRQARGGSRDATLDTTALVNEAFVKLAASGSTDWRDRCHFMVLGRYMRQVLVDRGRRRRSIKRDGQLTELNTYVGGGQDEPDWALFDDAMERLQKSQPILYEVFQLHYFTGLQMSDIAQTLQCSERTVKRYWKAARLWLTDRISTQHD